MVGYADISHLIREVEMYGEFLAKMKANTKAKGTKFHK